MDRGPLASAARGLGHSPATMTRAIALLEGKLGMRLLHRSTRALRLTQFGETYYLTCREVLSALDIAERGAAAEQEQPSGLLILTAPVRFGQLHLRPVLDDFLEANRAVRARLILLDRVVNLVEEGIDIAVLEIWRFASARGKSLVSVAVQPRLIVNSAAAVTDSAIAGYGVARLMSYQAAAAVKAGELIMLLPEHEPPPIPVHLVMSSARSEAAKQRAFVAFAAPRLRQRLEHSPI